MVFYRKYRPQTIGELDSEVLQETLLAVLKGKDVPHAFLFTGPKGLGKTSTARIVAKVVNCKNLKNGEPCNICDECVSITNGTSIDVLEIDGASNRGIDEIRDLRERVKLAPSSARKKVYIIDEVHMLTTEAFNALLKTIEEPPSHVMFIFCTTEPHKVPATILSRCFHISFSLATDKELVHSLERIIQGEKVQADAEALLLLAHLAEGGFRDAAKILEEMVALAAGKPITRSFIEEKYHVAGVEKKVSDLIRFLCKKQTKEALHLVNELVESGMDIKYFMSQLLTALHILLLQTVEVEEKKVDTLTIGDVSLLLQLFSESFSQIKYAVIAQLPLEIAIVAWGESQQEVVALANLQAPLNGKTTIDTLVKKQQSIKVKSILYPQKEEKQITASKTTIDQPDIISRPTDENVALMENIIYKIKAHNSSIAGVLRSCKVKQITDEKIIFEAAYSFHKERLEDIKTCEIIEKIVKEITGKQLHLIAVLRGGEK